ncbi:unnamed protein product, partial [Urochloa humidicola]
VCPPLLPLCLPPPRPLLHRHRLATCRGSTAGGTREAACTCSPNHPSPDPRPRPAPPDPTQLGLEARAQRMAWSRRPWRHAALRRPSSTPRGHGGAQLLICAASPRAGRIQSRRPRFLSQDFKSLQEPPSLFPAPATVSSGGERGEKCCHGSSPVAGADERCGSKATSLEANGIELQGLLLLHSNHGTHVSAYGVVRVGRQ